MFDHGCDSLSQVFVSLEVALPRRTGTASPLGEMFDHGCDSLSQVFVSLEVALPRRTGTASPLGEMFDHGCDSLSQVFVSLEVALARRTGTASPLGEMFDHGCDSLSQVFISLEVALAMRLGYHPDIMLLGTLYSLLLFYSAHWQTYCSGHLQFHKFDVTEAQFLVIFICLVSGIFGPRFWAISIFNIIELRVLAMLVSTLMGLRQLYQYLEVVFTGGVGKNGSTVADTSVIFPVIPIAQALIPALMIYYKSTETGSIFVEHIVLYLITIGLVTSKITNRLIVAHMCKSELIAWDSILYGPLMIFLNQYFNNILPEYAVLVVCCAYCSLNLLCYCVVVCNQICDYLRIRCFVIAPPPPTPTPATREPLKTAYERR